MNLSQLPAAINAVADSGLVPFVVGSTGIGKTEVIKQWADARGLPCHVWHLAQFQVEDITGLPSNVDGRTSFLPPVMFPTVGPCILFLDEFDRASPDVHKAALQLLRDRCVAGHHLPEGCIVVAAGNENPETYAVNALCPALRARVVRIPIEPSVTDWLGWAVQENVSPAVCGFITTHPDQLFTEKPPDVGQFPTPRAWAALGGILDALGDCDANFRNELVAGAVGHEAAIAFAAFTASRGRSCITAAQVLAGNDVTVTHAIAQDLDSLSETLRGFCDSALPILAGSQAENLRTFLLAVRPEQRRVVIEAFMRGTVGGFDQPHELRRDWVLAELSKDATLCELRRDWVLAELSKDATLCATIDAVRELTE